MISNIRVSQYSCSVRLVCIWDNFFSSNSFGLFSKNLYPPLCLVALVKSAAFAKSLINSIYKIVISVQGRSSICGYRFWKYPFQIAIKQCFSMHLHSFGFLKWNKVVVYCSAQLHKSSVNLLTTSLHANNNLRCQRIWITLVTRMVVLQLLSNELLQRFLKDFKNRCIITIS